jgi:hypothetical protein
MRSNTVMAVFMKARGDFPEKSSKNIKTPKGI